MATVVENLRLFKLLALSAFTTEVVLTHFCRNHARWYYVGIGLAVQTAIMFILSLAAHHRAGVYIARLQEFVPQVVP